MKQNTDAHPPCAKVKEVGKLPRYPEIVVGQIFSTNLSGDVTVLAYNSAIDIVVQFGDGAISKVPASDLRKGKIRHPYSGLDLNKTYTSNSGWTFKISEFRNCFEVDVVWQDGSKSTEMASHIHSGGIKPLNQPSVCGIGFFGTGRFVPHSYKLGEKAPEHILAYWHRMINRCYNPIEMVKSSSRYYVYVEVCKEWHNFQNFAEWAMSQPNHDYGYDLEKDLLGDSLLYSPDNCCFIPQIINVALAESRKSVHNLPVGVHYLKPGSAGAKDGYVARCHSKGGRKYLGYYDDPMSAYFAYKVEKEMCLRNLAEEFKGSITREAYGRLANYTLDTVYPINRELSTEDLEKKIKEKLISNGIPIKE